jgi:hypothetical protein
MQHNSANISRGELRSRKFWGMVADRLPDHPEAIEAGRQLVQAWISMEAPKGLRNGYRQHWLDLLELGATAVIAVLRAEDDWGQVMRSCCPLGYLVLPHERRLVWGPFE